jgi:hypothetical protein
VGKQEPLLPSLCSAGHLSPPQRSVVNTTGFSFSPERGIVLCSLLLNNPQWRPSAHHHPPSRPLPTASAGSQLPKSSHRPNAMTGEKTQSLCPEFRPLPTRHDYANPPYPRSGSTFNPMNGIARPRPTSRRTSILATPSRPMSSTEPCLSHLKPRHLRHIHQYNTSRLLHKRISLQTRTSSASRGLRTVSGGRIRPNLLAS